MKKIQENDINNISNTVSYSVESKAKPHVFGIRHLSPAGAYYLRRYLSKIKPKLILIEGPSDFNYLLPELGSKKVKPPVAVMAYTVQPPVRTVLYPFAVYSPEYQAMVWAVENKTECRFCDLPSSVFLGLEKIKQERTNARLSSEAQKDKPLNAYIHQRLDELSEDKSNEVFWERTMEQAESETAYIAGSSAFGMNLRQLTLSDVSEDAENIIRESYMLRIVEAAVSSGILPGEIVMVVGAFHIRGILSDCKPMTEDELNLLPELESNKTLLPYSYFRLSERSGYGAGNKAPAYYEMLWEGLNRQEADYAPNKYLSSLSSFLRAHGSNVSSAEVIEALRLSYALAQLHGSSIPTLKDIRDAAITCIGHGNFSEIVLAVADTEIGVRIGEVPEGLSLTSIQSDFNRKIKELKLEKYKSLTAQDLQLDLRENLRVKSKEAAFIDLERSFFLHKLRLLGIDFAKLQGGKQENATWSEPWVLCWTPEAEIQIVEAVLKGDTVELAAAFEINERLKASASIAELAALVNEAFYCGMPKSLETALNALQKTAVEAAALDEIAKTASSLSPAILYGDIRKLDSTPVEPILSQLFLRACLILPDEAACDDEASKIIAQAVISLHEICIRHDFLDKERWIHTLLNVSARDDLNPRLSGLAAAILLEMGGIGREELGIEVERRLSKGVPAELGASWFEGLAMKNRYALIARLSLWEKLSAYLDTLNDEEFKRSLIFLRRAFSDFSSEEKYKIAENLAEIWNINPVQAAEALNGTLNLKELEAVSGLDDFDFEDI